jgi:hypothetical protein
MNIDTPGTGYVTTGSNLYWPAPSPSVELVSAALVKIQAEAAAAFKSGENKFDKYSYTKLEDFMSVGKPLLAKHSCCFTIEVTEVTSLEGRQTKNGGIEHAVRVRVVGTLRHSSGQSLPFPGYGDGQDRADKAIYKAMTGAKKYTWAGALAIPTTDDPEADEKVGLAPKPAPKVDSQGVTKTRVPKWADEQVNEAGGYIGSIRELLVASGLDVITADMRIKTWRTEHKYDEPSDVIDQLALWKRALTEDAQQEGR